MYDWLPYEMLSYLSSFGANEGKAYVSEEIATVIIHLSRPCIPRSHWRSWSRFYTSLVLLTLLVSVSWCILVLRLDLKLVSSSLLSVATDVASSFALRALMMASLLSAWPFPPLCTCPLTRRLMQPLRIFLKVLNA
jgi:hypothetical protein